MSGLRVGSLFSGGGGLDLAVEEVFGARTVWHCENDAAAAKVLACRWPGVPNFGDITRVDWSAVEAVDILAGGFPCQDVSAAGRRAGLRHGTRSGTFHHLIQAVTVLRPVLVVLENTFGLMTADGDEWPDEVIALAAEADRWGRIKTLIDCKIRAAQKRGQRDKAWWHRKQTEKIRASRRHRIALAEFRRQRLRLVPRAIGTVLGCLAACGYDAQWVCLRASDVGAPHRRERIFIVASNTGYGREPEWARTPGRKEEQRAPVRHVTGCCGSGPVDLLPTPRASRGASTTETSYALGGSRDDENRPQGEVLLPTPRSSDCFGPGVHGDGGMDLRTTVSLLATPSTADGDGGHLNRSGDRKGELLLPGQAREMATSWGKYEPAIRRWETRTRPAPAPTEPNTKGNPRLAAAFSEWLMGWPDGWVTQVPGVSRNDALRIIGNGVVSAQAVAALQFLLRIKEVA